MRFWKAEGKYFRIEEKKGHILHRKIKWYEYPLLLWFGYTNFNAND